MAESGALVASSRGGRFGGRARRAGAGSGVAPVWLGGPRAARARAREAEEEGAEGDWALTRLPGCSSNGVTWT